MHNENFVKSFQGGWFEIVGRIAVHSDKRAVASHFNRDVIEEIKSGIVVDDPASGKWFAGVKAIDKSPQSGIERLSVRFVISRSPSSIPIKSWGSTLSEPEVVAIDFANQQLSQSDLELVYTFANIASVETNLEWFKEFVISELHRLKPQSLGK